MILKTREDVVFLLLETVVSLRKQGLLTDREAVVSCCRALDQVRPRPVEADPPDDAAGTGD